MAHKQQVNTHADSDRLVVLIGVLNVVYRYRYIVAAVEMVVILLVGYLFVVRSQVQLLLDTQQRTELVQQDVDRQVARYDKQIMQLREQQEAYAAVTSVQRNAINAMIPAEPQVKELFSQIHTIVRNNGLQLEAIELQDEQETPGVRTRQGEAAAPVDEGPVEQLQLTVSVVGANYAGLKGLLHSLQNNLRLIDITALTFEPQDRSVLLSLTAYFRAGETVAAEDSEAEYLISF